MNRNWPVVPLGEILRPVSRPEPVDSGTMYRVLGAHWYAKGLYIKEIKPGSQIQASKLFRVECGDFVYNRLFAWKGSFSIATEENHGCYVSNEFPVFIINRDRAEGKYLWGYFSRASAWDEALSLSSGGTPTSRNRLKEEKLLAIKIPLPPVEEQRRIVARIEGLAAKIEEARRLRKAAEAYTHKVLLGAYKQITEEVRWTRMAEIAPLVRRPVQINPSTTYHELGIRSFGKGTFHKPPIDGASLGTKKIFRIEANDLLFNIVFAWEAAVAVAKPQDHGRVGSHRFLTCIPRDGLATPAFLCFHFLTDEGLEQLGKASPGGAGRNRTLGLKALEEIAIPLPALNKQQWFCSLVTKGEFLKRLQAETAAELDAMLPSILDKAFRESV